ncbi:MAG: amidohydrolase family protein [Verrucomicrobia bacterium]|nr:amidohydrolase family protein [Verrucomicrobiota bacterium]MDA1065796.1 amidohydrolase family protein [Verrucomicrobiota bacterium]
MKDPTVTRRRFIQTAGIATAALATSSKSMLAADGKPELIIDCHAHLYSGDDNKYPTRENPNRPPAGTGFLEHLKQEMKAAGVRHVTAVQPSSYYLWDNRFTADSSRANSDFMVGVVTLDPDNPYSPEMMEYYVSEFNVRGMRSVPAKSGNLDDPGVEKLWTTAERLGIVINVLSKYDKHEEIKAMAKRHPGLSIVLDHCLGLKLGDTYNVTLKAVLDLAKLPNLHTKLTLIPLGTKEPYPCRDMHDSCKMLIDVFTPQRCVWGSHFPTALFQPKVSYAQHLKLFTHELGLDDSSKKAILGETAHRLWFV